DDAGKRRAKVLAAAGIFLTEGEPIAKAGKIAFLFPGQGSQYLGMLKDLAENYPVVADTFREADAILMPLLGDTLTHIVWSEASEAADLRLRETQNTQPAMLTADVAMLRLLMAHGVSPSMVAGHSLGEYAAAVASGVLSFADALYAVSARGREMAGVKVEDNGKMAVVAGDAAKVEAALAGMEGYIIAANKNCHTQTVIAGESAVVDAAVEQFAAAGIEAKHIPVSHAFHCKIVAPAAEPLSRVLRNLDIQAPKVPLLSNVDASYYPADKAAIVDLMARQLASPVEFISQVERMYADGARIFVEVGPRRAITGFVRNILGSRDHRAYASNHHKKSSTECFLELLAGLASDGVPVQFEGGAPVQAPSASASAPASSAPREAASPRGTDAHVVVSGMAVALPSAEPVGKVGDDLFGRLLDGENFIHPLNEDTRRAILDKNVIRLNKAGGEFTPLKELSEVIQLVARMGEVDLVRDYGIDGALADALDDTGKLAIAVGIDALRDAGLPLARRYRETSTGKRLPDRWALPPALAKRTGVVMASAFPGLDKVIDEVSRHAAAVAARRSADTLESFVEEWAGTLRDPSEAARLRAAYRERVGALRDEAALYAFNRKFLLRVLSLGHAQVAQTILAQGPNTQINAACASGTQAMGIADDWLRQGRCDRVLIVSCDNVTSETSLPWFAAAFLAA
ncbi:MAG TPA: acyltransferase domain-containing protein, partial [Myxococcota bacterium]|nr:acyltransferase domain-containing protein [Myxococcota bacterium]